MTHYYIAYHYSNRDSNGHGSMEVSIKNDVFVPSEVREFLKEKVKAEGLVIVNWIALSENQLAPDSTKIIEGDQDED